jgi:transposase
MNKRHVVRLTDRQRATLHQQASVGQGRARALLHARILLKAEQGPSGLGWTDNAIAAALDASRSTVERVRKRFAEAGLDAALAHRRPRREYRRKLDGEQEAHLVALACTPPPVGRRRWTLRLLADKLVELRYIDGVSYETVRQVLKKNRLKPWLTKRWCVPPEQSGEFVWRMEDILEVYTRPYDPKRPQVASTRPARSSSGMLAPRAWRSRASRRGRTTSTNGTAPRICSW